MANSLPVTEAHLEHSGDDSDDDDDDAVEIHGRWEKRRQEVTQRDVPGIDHPFLAMDTEEGVEVVWNEVQFSEKKDFKSKIETIEKVFENLIQLDHVNIVKFHGFWTDPERARMVFITEYMTSGSLKQFLKKSRKNKFKSLTEKVLKRWCRQILSALSYLHGCEVPVVHGNLSCDTIFIQHDGLIKIGSVAPDTIHNHVKTCREEQRNMHFIAPEYGIPGYAVGAAVDVYAFGMCVLEMAVLELHDNEGPVSTDAIQKAIQGLEHPMQKQFILRCLTENPEERPSVRDLLLDPYLFEVHSLRLLAAHCMVDNDATLPDNGEPTTEPEKYLAVLRLQDGTEIPWKPKVPLNLNDLEKFLEEVRNGLHPLTGLEQPKESRSRQRPKSPENTESVQPDKPESYEPETRKIISMRCETKPLDAGEGKQLILALKLEDKMNRQLTCDVKQGEEATDLANELVQYGFINEADHDRVTALMLQHLHL